MSFDYSKLASLRPRNLEEKKDVSNATPVGTPVATPVGTPVGTPVATPVGTPVATPVDTPATMLALSPQSEPVGGVPSAWTSSLRPPVSPSERDARIQPTFGFADPIDATHSASEQKLYSVMYRSDRERHWGFRELSRLTGIRSDATIRRAIDGLIAKLSIEIVSYHHGNPLGPRYRIFAPKEIVQRRKKAGIEIEPQSKAIRHHETDGISSAETPTPVATPVGTPVATPVGTPVATGVNDSRRNCGSTPVETTGVATGVFLIHENNHVNHDDDSVARWMRAFFGEDTRNSASATAKAAAEIQELVTAFLEAAAKRATVHPVHPAFFVTCLKTALTGAASADTRRGQSRARQRPEEPDATQSTLASTTNTRELLRAIAHEFRHANSARTGYTETDLQRDLTEWADANEVVDNDGWIENAILTTRSTRPGPDR